MNEPGCCVTETVDSSRKYPKVKTTSPSKNRHLYSGGLRRFGIERNTGGRGRFSSERVNLPDVFFGYELQALDATEGSRFRGRLIQGYQTRHLFLGQWHDDV